MSFNSRLTLMKNYSIYIYGKRNYFSHRENITINKTCDYKKQPLKSHFFPNAHWQLASLSNFSLTFINFEDEVESTRKRVRRERQFCPFPQLLGLTRYKVHSALKSEGQFPFHSAFSGSTAFIPTDMERAAGASSVPWHLGTHISGRRTSQKDIKPGAWSGRLIWYQL